MKNICILLIFTALLSFGCGKDKVKPSEDYLLSTKAIESINTIKEAYEDKKEGTLKKRTGPGLSDSILEEIDFEKAELTLTTRMVNIKDSSVVVNVNWRGTWWLDSGKIENRGAANLVLDKETMSLLEIEGDNPFSIPKLRSY